MRSALAVDNHYVLQSRTPKLSPKVAERIPEGDRLGLVLVDQETYKRFRCLEPSLSSCLDDLSNKAGARTFFVAAELDGVPVGVTSIVVQNNPRRQSPFTSYGRIDLVIVDPEFRSLRIGRLLVTAALLDLLDRFGSQLYSVSCLAAHPAMERILDTIGFTKSQRDKKNYVHEELKLEKIDRSAIIDQLTRGVEESLQQTRFKLRQTLGRAIG